MSSDLISVILPVYNAEKYLAKSMKCILGQTYKNIEVIIVDDGSSDTSREIAASFKDERIKYYQREHEGLIAQLNFGLEAASGNFIARMDADDLCDLNRFTTQLSYLKENSAIKLVSTNYNYIDETDRVLSRKAMPGYSDAIEYMMPILNLICHAGMLTYKRVIMDAGGYSEKYLFVEDQELFLRMLTMGIKMHNIQEYLYSYRLKGKGISPEQRHTILKNRYRLGYDYVEQHYAKHPEGKYHYNFRHGLVEYYSGNINTARKYFLKALGSKHAGRKSIWRYLLPTLMGNTILNLLREKNILSKLSLMMNRRGKDYHTIVKNDK
jgi:glycosyltransferase involved in cell wall biosynthesis